jgi:hypothetical protein
MYFFSDDYREKVTLGDGTQVLLRTLRPEDKELLLRGFETLSPQSRYLRFLTSKPTLTDEELEKLTRVDGVTHFALAAISLDPTRPTEGLGVARFVRLEEDPTTAEAAITVVDRAQCLGLGSLLMLRLSAAAKERGVLRFTCEFFSTNTRIRHMLESFAAGGVFEYDGGDLMRAELPVPDVSPTGGPSAVPRKDITYRILGDSARGAIRIRLRRLLLKLHDE